MEPHARQNTALKRNHLTEVRPVFLAAVVLFCGSLAFSPKGASTAATVGGITLHQQTTISGMPVGQGHGETTETTFLSAEAVRHSSSNGNDFIVRKGEGKLITIDHNKKTYSEITFEEIQKAMKKAASGVTQDQEALQSLRQMTGGKIGNVTLTEQGSGGVVAGFVTRKYFLDIPPLEMQIWSAPELQMPSFYYDALKLRTQTNPLFDMRKVFEAFKKMNGLAVKTIVIMKVMQTTMTVTTEVTSVEKAPLPTSTFEIPPGYTQIEPQLFP